MKQTSKIQAFTIVELLVAMVISGIVLTLAGGLYLNIQKLFSDNLIQYDKNNEILFLQSLIKNDFANAQEIFEKYDGIEITTNKNNRLYYDFNSDYIIRNSDVKIDSFFLKSENLNIEIMKDGDNLVSELSLDIIINDMIYPLDLHKEYSKSILFNLYKED